MKRTKVVTGATSAGTGQEVLVCESLTSEWERLRQEVSSLTPEQCRRIARAPISVGILSRLGTRTYGGCSSGGTNTTSDAPRVPVLDVYQHVTGWRRGATREG